MKKHTTAYKKQHDQRWQISLLRHARSASILFIISLVIYMINTACNIFVARHLSKLAFGEFSLGLRSFTIVSSILLLGTGEASKRFLSAYIKYKHFKKVHYYIAWNMRLILTAFIGFGLFLAAFLIIILVLHFLNIVPIGQYHLAFYLLFFTPLGAFVFLLALYLQCHRYVYLSTFLQNSSYYLLILIVMFPAIYFLDIAFSKTHLFFLILGVFVFLAVFEYFFSMIKLPRIFNAFKLRKYIIEDTVWRETAQRLILCRVAYLIIINVDIYIVAIFSSQIAVERYSAILVIVWLLRIMNECVSAFISPLVSFFLKNDKPYLQRTFNLFTVVTIVINAIFLPTLIFFAQYFLRFFGTYFLTQESVIALTILASAYTLRTFGKSSVLLLSYSGNERHIIASSLFELAVLLVSASILTHYYGMVGTTIGVALGVVVKLIHVTFVARRQLHFKPLGII